MTVTEAITAVGITPSATYTGEETNDDYILAIKTASTQNTPASYTVCQDHIKSHGAALNPKTTDETYLRAGTATMKTGNQRTFSIEGNRVVGDAFQDYCLSHAIMFGHGSDVLVPYVWFSIRTGKGETGEAMIIVNNDADGAAGDPAGIKIDLRGVSIPSEYTYTATA